MGLSGVVDLGVTSAGASTATVTTWTDLANAFTSSGTITLDADITAPQFSSLIMTAGTSVVLDLHGHMLNVTAPDFPTAAIQDTGATLTIEDTIGGGVLDAFGNRGSTSASDAAGIGGSETVPRDGSGGTLIINSGTVNASGAGAAAIGGSASGAGGTVTINGGTVNATGDGNEAGIGPGDTGAGGTVTINGGTVNATGGFRGAGIGGSLQSDGGTVTIHGGTVDATGGALAAGIGGGSLGSGAAVTIDSGATVTATSGGQGGSAIGAGNMGTSFGSLSNSGSLTLQNGEIIPPGATATNTPTGVITLSGELGGGGTMVNNGTVLVGSGGSVANGTTVTEHDYAVTYNLNGVAGTPPPPQTVYAATFSDDQMSLPPTPNGTMWSSKATSEVPVTNTTDLPTMFGESSTGATAVTLYVARSGTTLTATPALLALSPFRLYLFTLNATLTGPSGPIAGQTIVFSAGSTQLCSAITQSNGTASCGGFSLVATLLFSSGYTATYSGDATYLPSSAKAGLIG